MDEAVSAGHANRRVPFSQRARIVDAMVEVVCEDGFAGASVGRVCTRARVSHHTFYELFDSLEACFLAVLEEGAKRARELIADAFARERVWLDGVRAALADLLAYFDANPDLARVLLVEANAAGPWAREAREAHVAGVVAMIDEAWLPRPGQAPHPLASAGVMASLLGVLHTRLVAENAEPLIALLGPMMGLVAAPYLPPDAVGREVARSGELADRLLERARSDRACGRTPPIPRTLSDPRAHRARACLLYLAVHPGASNREVAEAAGIGTHTQISALLTRLSNMGLLRKRSAGPGHANAWFLTTHGEAIADAIVTRTGVDG